MCAGSFAAACERHPDVWSSSLVSRGEQELPPASLACGLLPVKGEGS